MILRKIYLCSALTNHLITNSFENLILSQNYFQDIQNIPGIKFLMLSSLSY